MTQNPPNKDIKSDPLIGRKIKGYQIVKRLGEGGMGKVYLAEHPKIGKKIAIKLIRPHLTQDPNTLARFFTEARAVNEIQHHNVIDIIDFDSTPEGEHFLLMEFLDGKSLSTVAKQDAPIPEKRIGNIVLQICSALYAAHQKGIIHRDLKPENIFLLSYGGSEDFVKVLDFGVAKLLYPTETIAQTDNDVFLGSPICISPEQADGLPIDGRCDIYSLGIVLYLLATGSFPFWHEDPIILISMHLLDSPPLPRYKNPSISSKLESIILRCLEKKKEDRFSSMKELAVALSRATQAQLPRALSPEPEDSTQIKKMIGLSDGLSHASPLPRSTPRIPPLEAEDINAPTSKSPVLVIPETNPTKLAQTPIQKAILPLERTVVTSEPPFPLEPSQEEPPTKIKKQNKSKTDIDPDLMRTLVKSDTSNKIQPPQEPALSLEELRQQETVHLGADMLPVPSIPKSKRVPAIQNQPSATVDLEELRRQETISFSQNTAISTPNPIRSRETASVKITKRSNRSLVVALALIAALLFGAVLVLLYAKWLQHS